MSPLRLRRPISVAVAAALLAGSVLVVSVSAGDSRHVFVGSGTDGVLPTGISISGGETIPFVLTVTNDGKQTLNNVVLTLGKDGDSTPEANPQRTYVPTQPVPLPTGVTVTASGADATTAGCDAGGSLLTCTVGTLTSLRTLKINVTISTTQTTPAAVVPLKAVVTVSEVGNDNGANTDTFAAEGGITVLAFSCESIAAYRGSGQSKTVSTCALGNANNTNFQFASVIIPAALTQVTLTEGQGPACPVTTCYGQAVKADILGDSTSDVVSWTIQVNLTKNSLGKPNLQQLTVIHENDAGVADPIGGISLAKKNACSLTNLVNCGNAFLTTDANGDTILNIYVQTRGNGGIRAW